MIDLLDDRDASNKEDFTCALAIGISYLKSLDIGIPIAWYEREKIREILELDANAKYINYIKDSPLDDCNKTGILSPWNPNIEERLIPKQRDHSYDEEGTNSVDEFTDKRAYRHERVTGREVPDCECC